MGKTNPEVFLAVTRESVYYDPKLPPELVSLFKGVRTYHQDRHTVFRQCVRLFWEEQVSMFHVLDGNVCVCI